MILNEEQIAEIREAYEKARLAYNPPLDAGIMVYVHILNGNGIETYESCEGGAGHSYPNPTIAFRGTYGDGFRALAVCLEHNLPVFCLRRVWRMEQGEPVGPFWELEFTQKGVTVR